MLAYFKYNILLFNIKIVTRTIIIFFFIFMCVQFIAQEHMFNNHKTSKDLKLSDLSTNN